MNAEIQEIKIKDYQLTQQENDVESFVEGTYNEMVLGLVNKIKNQKTWGMTASTIFINRLFRKQERIATVEFSLENRNYGAKVNFPNLDGKKEFNVITDNIKQMKSHYLERFNYQDAQSAKSLLNIFVDYIASNDISECFENDTAGVEKDLREESSYVSLEDINSITKATLKNWENDFIIGLDVSDTNQDEKLINKSMILPAYHNLFAAISQDNYIFVFGTSAANQHYVDERVKDIDNVLTFSLSIFKATESPLEIFDKFHLFSSTYRNVMLYEFAADLNKNIESSLGEAAEIARYWYTTAVQKILKESKVEKASDSELFAKLLVEEILAADIEGVETLETYPFDRVFIFNRPIDRLIKEGDTNTVSVAEALLASKISITQQYINGKAGGMDISEISVHEDRSGSSQYLFEWQRNRLDLKEHEINFNKKLIKNQSNMKIDKLKDKYDFKSDYHASDEIVIHSLLNILLHGEELNDVDAAKQALLEYKAKYFKDDFLYLYATGVDLSKEIPILHQFQEKYFQHSQNTENLNLELLKENEFLKQEQDYMSEEDLRNVKVVLASYAPRDEESEDGFTIIVVANQDPVKTTSELNSERDDLRTALELVVRQKFVLQKEYDGKSRLAKEDTFKTLTQAQHTLDNFLKDRIENPSKVTDSDLQTLRTKIHDLLSPMTESLSTDKKEDIFHFDHEDTLSRSLEIFKKFFIDNKRFDFMASEAPPYDFFAQKIIGLQMIEDRLVILKYPIRSKTKSAALKLEKKHQPSLIDNSDGKNFSDNVARVDELIEKGLKKKALSISTEEEIEKKEPLPTSEKFIELTIDFNELEAFTIDWDQEILQDVLHVMFKNACEASYEYIEKTGKEKAKIFIDLFTSKVDNENVSLNIEFTNFTSEPISKSRLNDINTKTNRITENTHKTNSSGIGVPTARGRLQHRYNDEDENAGINYTLLARDKVKSRLYIPISLIIDNDIFAEEEITHHIEDIEVFYLEDAPEYFEENKTFFNTLELNYNHRSSYQGFKSLFGKEKVLITDLNIYETEDTDMADQQHGLDAIKHFMKKCTDGTVIILSTGYEAAKNELKEISQKYKYTIYDKGEYKTIQKQSVYIYDKKTFSEEDSEIISFLNEYASKPYSEELSKETDVKVSLYRTFETVAIEGIDTIQKYTLASDVNAKAFVLDLRDKETELRPIIKEWKDHDVMCDDEEYSISSPVRGSYFKTKLILVINEKSNYSQVRHESLKHNIVFVSSMEEVDKTLEKLSSLLVNSNGVFSPIRHDFAKVKPFGTISQEDIEYFAPACSELEELFLNDYEKFLSNEKIDSRKKIMKEFYTKFNFVIEEATKLDNELGENRKILTDLFNRYYYYYSIGGVK